MLTKPCFMNKLIEDMERLGTKRVPDRFIQRERAPAESPFIEKPGKVHSGAGPVTASAKTQPDTQTSVTG